MKILPKYLGIFVLDKTSVAIKNGSNEGTTELAQSLSPDFAACIFDEENNTRHTINIKNNKDKKFFLNLKTNI